jgi:hypothetical protein
VTAEQPPVVQPQPVPMSFGVGVVQDPLGNKLIVLQLQHPMGSTVLFFDLESAASLAGQVRAAVKQAGTSLILPAAGLAMPMNGHHK